MVICPNCRANLPAATAHCSCGLDLAVLVYFDQLPDYFFNKAVAAEKRGDVKAAVEWISATIALRSSDEEAQQLRVALWQSIDNGESEIEKNDSACQDLSPDSR